MTRFGFELEFAIDSDHHNCMMRYNPFPHMFSLGYDSSARLGDLSGAELRGGIFTEGFPRNKFKSSLEIIKGRGGIVHKTCGFHIHFSGAGEINPTKMINFLKKRNLSWGSRDQWCGLPYSRHNKYSLFRHIEGDHYEIRAFNASLNIRGLEQMFRIAERAIEESREGSRLIIPLAS